MAVEMLPPYQAGPDNPRWHELRRAGVSASDIAALLGISPWQSPFSLWWAKREGWEQEPSDEMSIGTAVEGAVVDLWADRCDPHENLALMPAGLYFHPDRPWQLATPDRLVGVRGACATCDGAGTFDSGRITFQCPDCDGAKVSAVLECKWAGSWDGWGEDGSDDIPAYYRAQVLWQCDVLELPSWSIGVLGPSGFRAYHGSVDRAAQRDLVLMRTRALEFMRRLEADQPPDIDDGHPATITTLRRLHPSVEDVDVEVPASFADGWRRARAIRKRATELCDRYEARARHILGDGHRLTTGGRLVASRSIYDRKPYDVGPATIDKLNPGKAIR
jgi:putative phage-type endonuclease